MNKFMSMNMPGLRPRKPEETKIKDPTKIVAKKKMVETKHKIVGTADYVAPEVIQGKEHTFALDYYSLGVIIYEFLTGGLPFNDDTPEKIFKNALIGKYKTEVPVGENGISYEAKDLMDRLICLDPNERLGSKGV